MTLTDGERKRLMGAVIAKMHDKSVQVVPVVESILSARLDALHAENAELRQSLDLRMDSDADARSCGRNVHPWHGATRKELDYGNSCPWCERDALHAKLRARENDVDRLIDERDALRDAITALADEMERRLRALLSEAGERRE